MNSVRRSETVTKPTIGSAADFILYKDGYRTDEVRPTKLLQVYAHHTPESDDAIVKFWKAERALPRHDDDLVLQRLSEVLFVMVRDQSEITGLVRWTSGSADGDG